MSFRTTYDDREVKRLFAEFPKIANQQQNRAFKAVAQDFGRHLSKHVFSGAGAPFRVRRRGNVRAPARGQPKLAKKAVLAGMKAVIGGIPRLDRKTLSVRTSNPLLLIREEGGVIRAKRKKWLALSFKRRGRRKKGTNTNYELRLVKEVRQAPVLGIQRRWNARRLITVQRLDKAVSETIRRAERKASRGRLRRAS